MTTRARTATGVRPSDVGFSEVTFAPVAECSGSWKRDDDDQVVQDGACTWRRDPTFYGEDVREIKRGARLHAAQHPGHEVLVTRRTVAVYRADPPRPVPDTDTPEEKP